MRRLIINADDYGMCPGVSAGIRRSAFGIVRSTTVMANLVTQGDIDALHGSGLRAGVHLNLSYGPPLTQYHPDLLDYKGHFSKARALEPQTWTVHDYLAAADAEWTAQIERLSSMGLIISHIDSHHHTHMIGGLMTMAEIHAVNLGVGMRCRLEHLPLIRQLGIPAPDRFIEGYFAENNIGRANLLALLNASEAQMPSEGTAELMCHPGLVDEVLLRDSSYVHERETELAVLGDPFLAGQLAELGWQLSDYTHI
jgi:predicted glycoside hydrolase/deacetylase ChbG (UPF0249 family)